MSKQKQIIPLRLVIALLDSEHAECLEAVATILSIFVHRQTELVVPDPADEYVAAAGWLWSDPGRITLPLSIR
jgi:hypothetical protein